MRYELITDSTLIKTIDSPGLNEKVNEKLAKGYDLYGNPGVFNSTGKVMFYQAVTNAKENNN